MALNSIRNRIVGNDPQPQEERADIISITPAGNPAPVPLSSLFIQSHDTLRGLPIPVSTDNVETYWNDRPPLLLGPKGQPESLNLLKGLLRFGVPPPLRCAVWLSNVVLAVQPHQPPQEAREYRTLAKVRALENAYETVIKGDIANDNNSNNNNNGSKDYNKNGKGSNNSKMNDGHSTSSTINRNNMQMPSLGQEKSVIDDSKLTSKRNNGNHSQSDTEEAECQAAANELVSESIENVTKEGRQAVKRVLLALVQVSGLEYAPMVPTLTALLLTCMSESYAFCTLRQMTHHLPWFFPTTKAEHMAFYKAFADVCYKLHPQTAEYLDDRGVLDDLSPIFSNFFVGVLPLKFVLRIMDLYTLEGHKVLFRFGVALFVLYKKESSEQLITISNAQEWWHTLAHWTHHPLFNFDYLVRKAYGVHGRAVRHQMRFPSRNILNRIIRMEQTSIQQQLDDDAEEATYLAQPLGLVQDLGKAGENFDAETIKPVLAQSVQVRSNLAQWVPMTLRLTKLKLLYSTNYHGRTLEMFYRHVGRAKHSILLCEIHDDSGKKEPTERTIIGMYASQAWRESTQVYGDGECFMFRLQPEAKCWKWHPALPQDGGDDDVEDTKLTALLEQFMVGRRNFISMGGNPDGSCGLRINEDLTVGESSPAVGFDNEPLHQYDGDNQNGNSQGMIKPSPSFNSVFSIGLVEVYSFVRQIGGSSV